MAEAGSVKFASSDGEEFTLSPKVGQYFFDLFWNDPYRANEAATSGRFTVNAKGAVIRLIFNWIENREVLPPRNSMIKLLPYDEQMLFPDSNYTRLDEVNKAGIQLECEVLNDVLAEIAWKVAKGKTPEQIREIFGEIDLEELEGYKELKARAAKLDDERKAEELMRDERRMLRKRKADDRPPSSLV